jgi:iron complex outermembrane receptor protein
MSFSKNILTLSILAIASSTTFAEEEKVQQLETIEIKAHPLEQTSRILLSQIM